MSIPFYHPLQRGFRDEFGCYLIFKVSFLTQNDVQVALQPTVYAIRLSLSLSLSKFKNKVRTIFTLIKLNLHIIYLNICSYVVHNMYYIICSDYIVVATTEVSPSF